MSREVLIYKKISSMTSYAVRILKKIAFWERQYNVISFYNDKFYIIKL